MDERAFDFAVAGHAIAAVAFVLFAVSLAWAGYARRGGGEGKRWFLTAVVATAAWAGLAAVDAISPYADTAYAVAAADLLRYALWFGFLLQTLQPSTAPGRTDVGEPPQGLRWAAIALVAVAAASLAWRIASGQWAADASRWSVAAWLGLPVLGLLLVEQLFRNLPEDSRWNAKPVCLALGLTFVYDVYLHAEAVLLGRLDADALSIRGVVHALAIPLLVLAARRRADWIRRLHVSRTAAFHSATLLLAGGYLLLMSAAGYYVRYFGGQWGRALQLALLVAGLAALAMLGLSGSMRARVRVFIGKHFFSYRYDYREEWLRFTAMLSTRGSPQEVGGLVVRGLANMVECPAGSLWTRTGSDAEFRQTARWNQPAQDQREPADSEFSRFLQQPGWVIDIDEYRNAPRRYGQLALPSWLLAQDTLWLVVPLPVGDELLGFVTLARPRTPMELNWEVRDLLKTASRQAAGFLAQMHATEALLEARKFEAFNRMSAFVVHDLKNIVTQLSLMMKNAQRLHANPEFQQDMLLTVESSLEKMRRLMLQLREGATPPGGTRGVEIAPILARLAAMAAGRGRSIEVDCDDGLATRGHDDRLERVLGHLVHNALDATAGGGRVWVQAARHSGQVKVQVGDTGVGMSEDFVRERLFRPFSSTKTSGMGIGLYESAQYIRELGGHIDVDSAPGRGTTFTLLMPLFQAHADSVLQMPAVP